MFLCVKPYYQLLIYLLQLLLIGDLLDSLVNSELDETPKEGIAVLHQLHRILVVVVTIRGGIIQVNRVLLLESQQKPLVLCQKYFREQFHLADRFEQGHTVQLML